MQFNFPQTNFQAQFIDNNNYNEIEFQNNFLNSFIWNKRYTNDKKEILCVLGKALLRQEKAKSVICWDLPRELCPLAFANRYISK